MRRSVLALLLLPVAAFTATPAAAGAGTCASSGGVTACPTAVMRCAAGDVIRVHVAGVGHGSASCGGVTAWCAALRAACNDDARATSGGPLTCHASGSAVAVCSVGIESLR